MNSRYYDASTIWGNRRSLARQTRFQTFSDDLTQLSKRVESVLTQDAIDACLEHEIDLLREEHEELLVVNEELREQLEELEASDARLQEERARHQVLFEASPDAYVLTDAYGVVRECNPAASELFDMDLRFLRGKPLAALIVSDDAPVFRDALVIVREERAEVTVRVQPRHGDTIACALAGSMAGPTSVFWRLRVERARDQAPRDHASATRLVIEAGDSVRELRAASEVSERELARERAACEDLQIENRAKDRFIALLSHELRAPLTAVLGWAQILRREHLDDATREKALATIERNARAQAVLVDELLDVSRITTGKLSMNMSPIDLASLVRSCVHAALPTAARANVEIRCRAEGERIHVLGDPGRLTQIVNNLLSNALKFTPGGGEINVVIRREHDNAELTIRDTGRGIPQEWVQDIFECFRQAGDTRKETGLGLGLYIVRHLVERHGGTVAARSDGEGKGSTFTIRLPVLDQSAAADSSTRIPVAVARPDLGDLRILVVDDEADTRDLVCTVLRAQGADVTAAADVETALAMFDEEQPDVVVSDLRLGEMDGNALIREIRTRRDSDVPAVAVSGSASTEEAQEAIEAGYDAHLRKPISTDALVKAVETAATLRRRPT